MADEETQFEEQADVPEAVEAAAELMSPYDPEPEPVKTVKLKYAGPEGMTTTFTGALEPGETYEVPADAKDELLAHPGGWWKSAGSSSSDKKE